MHARTNKINTPSLLTGRNHANLNLTNAITTSQNLNNGNNTSNSSKIHSTSIYSPQKVSHLPNLSPKQLKPISISNASQSGLASSLENSEENSQSSECVGHGFLLGQGQVINQVQAKDVQNNLVAPSELNPDLDQNTTKPTIQVHDSLMSTVPNIIHAYEKQCEYTAKRLNAIRDYTLPELQSFGKVVDQKCQEECQKVKSMNGKAKKLNWFWGGGENKFILCLEEQDKHNK